MRPYFREYWCILSIILAESMHLRTPIVIIVRLWLDERIERIYNLTIPDNDDSHRANGTAFVVCRFKIYCCKILHYLSSLYLFHIL